MAIITIRPLPLKGSCNILVNFDSLKGMNFLFCVTNKFIHFPNANNDLLIEPVSELLFEFDEVFSLPAKSTKINLPKDVSL